MLINSELCKKNHIFLRTFKYIYHIFLRTFLLNHHIFLRTFRDLNREFCRNLRKKQDYDRFSWFFSLITCLQSSSHAYGLLWWRCLRVRNHMSAGLVAAELLNSPARRSIGLSLTTSWVAEPCFCSFTPACMLMQYNNTRKDNTILFINLHFWKGLKILETGFAPFLGVFQLYIE